MENSTIIREEGKVPTVVDFLSDNIDRAVLPHIDYELETNTCLAQTIIENMIAFAKLHVEAALKAATEKVELKADPNQDFRLQHCNCTDYIIDEQSILQAYSLDNIK